MFNFLNPEAASIITKGEYKLHQIHSLSKIPLSFQNLLIIGYLLILFSERILFFRGVQAFWGRWQIFESKMRTLQEWVRIILTFGQ